MPAAALLLPAYALTCQGRACPPGRRLHRRMLVGDFVEDYEVSFWETRAKTSA